MAKIQKENNFPLATIATLGDSQTDLISGWGVPAEKTWSALLVKRLNNSLETNCKVKAFGVAGDTTAQFIGRAGSLFLYNTPTIGIIYGGVNDPGSAVVSINATAGSVKTITLDTNTSASRPNSYVGNTITITAGAGSGQNRKIINYDHVLRVITVDSNWTTNPNNTSVCSISAPTEAQMQSNHQACIKILKYKAVGSNNGYGSNCIVWSQTELPDNGELNQRYVVMSDTSTTGGMHKISNDQHPTIVADYSINPKQSVWEFRVNRSGEFGWGRVAIETTPAFTDGVQKVITIGSNYLNWTTGGDNYNTNTNTGTQYAAYVTVRNAAKAAALIEGTVYCDLYDFQSKLINGGVFEGVTVIPEMSQGDNAINAAINNQHHGVYGHDTVARAVYHTIVNKGWVNNLK